MSLTALLVLTAVAGTALASRDGVGLNDTMDAPFPTSYVEYDDDSLTLGQSASEGAYPFMVAVFTDGVFSCGGTLVKKNRVVTAAHCVSGNKDYTVMVGEFDRAENSGNEQTIEVDSVVLHPEWNPRKIENDVAVLKLKESVDENEFVQPITQLATRKADKTALNQKTKCVAIGWGSRLNEFGTWTLSRTLQELPTEVITDKECTRLMLGLNFKGDICTKNNNGGTCSGDSGGPLVCYIKKEWTLMGVVSWYLTMDGCTRGAKGHARVSEYKRWIRGQY